MLGHEGDIELLKQAQNGDKKALEKFTQSNMPLVGSTVKRFLRSGYEYQDLVQIGCLGLVKAINRFDISVGVQFSTYAVPMIMGEIKRFIRDDNYVKIPRSLKNMDQELYYKRMDLAKELGREPSVQELSDYTGCNIYEVNEALIARGYMRSLSELAYYSSDSDNITLENQLKSNINIEETAMRKIDIHNAISKLPEIQQRIIILRMRDDYTQIQVAKILGVSQVHVSRNETKALKQLRMMLGDGYKMSKKDDAFKLFSSSTLNNKEIAEKINATEKTVSVYRAIYNKSNKEKKDDKNMSKRDEAFKLFNEGKERHEVAEILGLSPSTVSSYKNEWMTTTTIKETIKPKSIENDKNKHTSAPMFDISEQKKIKDKGIINKPSEHKILKPVLFEGEFMKYKIENESCVIMNAKSSLLIGKNKLDILIAELQELKKVI